MGPASRAVAPGISKRFAIRATPVAVDLRQPAAIGHAAGGSGRLNGAEQPGAIGVATGGEADRERFLDRRDRTAWCGEQGLLGLAADPRFDDLGDTYVFFPDLGGAVVVARYTATSGGRRADPTREVLVLHVAQPGEAQNGGGLAFGPNGYV